MADRMTHQIVVRVDDHLLAALTAESLANERTNSQTVRLILRRALLARQQASNRP